MTKNYRNLMPSIAAATVGLAATLIMGSVRAGPYYKIEVLAQTGQTTTTGTALTQIDPYPSINDSGMMAFLGTVAAGTSIFTADGSGDPILLAFSPIASRNYGSGIQINNAGQVVAEDQNGGNYFVRVWGPAVSSNVVVANGGSSSSDQFSGLSGFPSMNNNYVAPVLPSTVYTSGQPAYTGIAGQGGDLSLATECLSTCLAAPQTTVTSLYSPTRFNINAVPYGIPLRPMVADNGTIVTNLITSGTATSSIVVLPANLNGAAALAIPIASTGTQFTQLGNSPGISDDGMIVAFAAVQAPVPPSVTGLPGIFIAYSDGTTWSAPVQVAGLPAVPSAQSAELGFSDPDPTTGALTGLYISSVSLNSRVAVLHQQLHQPGAPALRDDAVVVSFVGTPSGPSRSIPEVSVSGNGTTTLSSTPMFFSDNLGLWSVRVDFDRPKDQTYTSQFFVHVNSVLPVLQVGDTIQTTLGPQVITALGVNDQLAAAATDLTTGLVRTQRRGDHRVGFYAAAGLNQFIIRGSHLDSNQDGLLDHWKEEGGGIDIYRTGIPSLSLFNWGASTSHRDLFIQMDWVSPRLAGNGTSLAYQLQPRQYVTKCLNQFFGGIPAIPSQPDCGGGAPELTGAYYGVRSDGAEPDPIPAGFTVHIDAGQAVDFYQGGALSLNPGSGFLQGGNEVCMPKVNATDPCSHPDVVFMGDPTLLTFPYGIAYVSLGLVKDAEMIAEDPARELAFHYVLFDDFLDVDRGTATGPYTTYDVVQASNVTNNNGVQIGALSISNSQGAILSPAQLAGVAGSSVMVLPPSLAAGTVRRIEPADSTYANPHVIEPWPVDSSGNVLVHPADPIVLLDASTGLASIDFNPNPNPCPADTSLPCDYLSRPGPDVIVAMGSQSRIYDMEPMPNRGVPTDYARSLEHELGHNLGLMHSGTGYPATTESPPVAADVPVGVLPNPSNTQACWNDPVTGLPTCWLPLHRSIMNYAFEGTPPPLYNETLGIFAGYVNDFSGASEMAPPPCPTIQGSNGPVCFYFQDWQYIRPDFFSTQHLLGNTYLRGSNGAPISEGPGNQGPEASFEQLELAASGGPIDVAAPSVTIQSPVASASISSGTTLTVTATATDNVAVASVQFQFDLNGDGIIEPATEIVTVTTPSTGGAYQAVFPAPVSGPVGQRVLTAVAFDTSFNDSLPYGVSLFIGSSGPSVSVPNVVGLTQAAASSTITGAGLTVGTVITASSPTITSGSVISESPIAGTSVASGSAVNLTVSTGPAQVSVPNVVGLTQAAASSAITGAGLTVGSISTASSPTVPSGNVISESPIAGTSVASGSAVNLTVSTGPAQVSVPNVVGLTQAAASSAITGVGLTVGTVITASSPTVPSGSVISESPVAGTSVASGSAVNLTVSTGPAQVSVPNVVGLTQAAASSAITGVGLTVGTVITASSPTVPSGSVISESPIAGTSVASGSAVNLTVSTGPAQVSVPNVVGLTQAAASSAITGAGLTVGTVITASSPTVPSGSVISESPIAGTSVASGSAVNLTVSTGPAQVSVPNVVGLTQAAGRVRSLAPASPLAQLLQRAAQPYPRAA